MRPSSFGLRHVALNIKNLEACEEFYTKLLGMKIEWKPDADNIYLTTGYDNLALHRAPADFNPSPSQHLDHVGFILKNKEEVEQWHTFLVSHHVTIKHPIKEHRDGTKSFYCADPDGNTIQFIFHPNIK